MNRFFKKTLTLVLSLLVIFGVTVPIASAYVTYYGSADMWLVDANTHKTASTINLYGKADYICLKLKKDSYKSVFCFEMYSDSKCKNQVAWYSTESSKGTKYVTLSMAFDEIKSGTYYVKTYVYKECNGYSLYNQRPMEIDPSTKRSYKIKITKKGTDIDDMNTVMYGFENTEKGPIVYWYSVPNATGYYVYKKNPDTGKYEKIGKAADSGKKTSYYLDKSLKGLSTSASYKVVAYKGSLKTPQSLLPLKIKAYKAPTVKVSSYSNNRIKISWSKISSKAEYNVYMSTDKANWKHIKSTKGLSFLFSLKNYDSNKKYYFTVIAVIGGIYSAYDESGVAYLHLKAPTLKACTYPAEGGITVNWEKVEGADSYRIYRRANSNDDWKKIADVGNVSSFTDKNVGENDYFYYTVRSVKKGALYSYSEKGKPGTILQKPVLNEVVEVKDGVARISWNAQPNQCKYDVYRMVDGSWKKIGSTKGTKFDYSLSYFVSKESFTVRPYRGDVLGPYDKTGVSYEYYPKVKGLYAAASESGVSLKWYKPKDVGDAVIYRKIADGEYEFLAQTDKNDYLDENTQPGVDYTYKIAYMLNDEIIEQTAEKCSVRYSDEIVNFVDKYYKAVNYKIGPSDYSYLLEIENYDPEIKYVLYMRYEGGSWFKNDKQIFTKEGIVYIPISSIQTQYCAVVKEYADGTVTLLPEIGTRIKYSTPPESVSLSFKADKATIKWSPESVKNDKIAIFYKDNLIASVPAADGEYTVEGLDKGQLHSFILYEEDNKMLSVYGSRVSYNYMDAPKLSAAEAEGGIKVMWSEIPSADAYLIYRKLPGETSWTKVGKVLGDKQYFVDKTVKDLTTYIYTVKASYADYYSPYDKNGVEFTHIVSPEFTLKNTEKGVQIKINAKKGVDGYIVRAHNGTSWKTLKVIDDPSKTTYLDTDVKSGQKKVYAVKAYKGDYEGYRTKSGNHYFLAQPQITSLSKTSKGVKVKFDKVEGATGYHVYKKTPGADKWTKVATTKSLEVVDTNVKSGTKYIYTVKAYRGSEILSAYNKNGWAFTYKK